MSESRLPPGFIWKLRVKIKNHLGEDKSDQVKQGMDVVCEERLKELECLSV